MIQMAFLEVKNVSINYETAQILRNVSIYVDQDEIVGIVGPNGAGKSTLLKTIVGLVRWERRILKGTKEGNITIEGTVKFNGEEIDKLPVYEVVRGGVILCPERRRPFRELTTLENLKVGAYLNHDKEEFHRNIDKVYQLFPRLKEREMQIAGTLSGGEQQMLNIGRAIMGKPRLLLVDEPTLGLSPMFVEIILEALKEIHSTGVTILLVEQDVRFAFNLTSRNYLFSAGSIVMEGLGEELIENEVVRKTFLGI